MIASIDSRPEAADSDPDAAESCPPLLACRTRTWIWLAVMILVQLVLYSLLTLLSARFHFAGEGSGRPLVAVLSILAVAFAAYLGSIPLALRLADSAKCVAVLFAAAIAFRAIVLFSEPIQEVDIYRYIWDGAVSGQGISPFRFPPLEVRQSIEIAESASAIPQLHPRADELQRLAALAGRRPGLGEVLRRVHYGELPTVYPPVSQMVFFFCVWLTPRDADVTQRVRWMKSIIVLFDLGVMGLLFSLLKVLRLNPGWCIAQGWSPLVIKEFANSGHLDSIAVFLCLASILCIALACRFTKCLSPLPPGEVAVSAAGEGANDDHNMAGRGVKRSVWKYILASGILLGLGVGAKLYPVVLIPLVACLVWRVWGWRWSIGWAAVASLVAVISLLPMTWGSIDRDNIAAGAEAGPQLQGLKTFLSRWEINDLVFMIVEENIRPEGSVEGQPHLWFAVTPDAWRSRLTGAASTLFGGDMERTPFLLARLVTMFVLGVLVLYLCRRTWKSPETFYEAAFLTLAWFWLLSPTQNPWYWSWALPLVPFARNRLWLLVSGLTLIYYSRFWFEYHAAATARWGIPYQGVAIFDFLVVWIEFAPFLILLSLSAYFSRKGRLAS